MVSTRISTKSSICLGTHTYPWWRRRKCRTWLAKGSCWCSDKRCANIWWIIWTIDYTHFIKILVHINCINVLSKQCSIYIANNFIVSTPNYTVLLCSENKIESYFKGHSIGFHSFLCITSQNFSLETFITFHLKNAVLLRDWFPFKLKKVFLTITHTIVYLQY